MPYHTQPVAVPFRPNRLVRAMKPVCLAVMVALTNVLAAAARAEAPSGDVVMKAMVDEMARGVAKLSLGDLPKPYFIKLRAQQREVYQMTASYGGLTRDDHSRSRLIESRVRVGSYELDNTNFRRPFGAAASLPLDDDYDAIRHTVWLVLDQDYKRAVEVYAAKKAYLESHNVEDRPDDFTKATPVVSSDDAKSITFDRADWASRLQRVSAQYAAHPEIQDGEVRMFFGRADQWLVNSEGTRLFTSDRGGMLEIYAETQAPDGMLLDDSKSFLFESTDELPDMDKLLAAVDTLCDRLAAQTKAKVLDQYTGPVLFEPKAAGSAFHSLFADRVAAVRIPLGAQWRDPSLEKKLGLRVLPRSFEVYDDPQTKRYDGKLLAGAYQWDDEGVRGERVSIVEKGKLKHLVSSRSPTRKVHGSNGHARSGGLGDPQASVACMYVRDEEGMSKKDLREELIEAAQDEGLDYALRVESMEDGGFMQLGAPIYAYKVYVNDGHEEPVRGLTFGPVGDRAIKRLLAGGDTPEVSNFVSSVSVSIIAPAVIFEELDLSKVEEEFDKLPILPAPGQRGKDQAGATP